MDMARFGANYLELASFYPISWPPKWQIPAWVVWDASSEAGWK